MLRRFEIFLHRFIRKATRKKIFQQCFFTSRKKLNTADKMNKKEQRKNINGNKHTWEIFKRFASIISLKVNWVKTYYLLFINLKHNKFSCMFSRKIYLLFHSICLLFLSVFFLSFSPSFPCILSLQFIFTSLCTYALCTCESFFMMIQI